MKTNHIPLMPPHALIWLLLAFALTAAPHLARLSPWIGGFCMMFCAWRLLAARRGWPLPGRWQLFGFTLLAAVGILASYGTLLGRDAGVAMLIVMLSLKLLEMRTLRDSMVVILLSYFLVISQFLYTQSFLTALYMLFAVLIITASLISLNHPVREHPWRKLKLAGVLLAQAAPMMLVLFILFPRVAGPLWGLPSDAHSGMTGLSDNMTPGSISKLSQSDAVAFRVNFISPLPAPALRYWRGPVMTRYDGRSWSADNPAATQAPQLEFAGQPVAYDVTLEPHNKRWLFALDMPAQLPPNSSITPGLLLLADQPVTQRMRYDMVSYPHYRAGLILSEAERQHAVYLPEDANPRTLALAAQWRRNAKNDAQVIEQALNMFHEQPFVYTLNPPLLGEDPVDDFLFNTQRGFCEHYAGSFAVLMRAAGIPARIVTGYQGGEVNPFGNYLIVRQSDAHAWVEIWLQGQGWLRVDPTAAVSSTRVEQGIGAALPAAEPLPALARLDNSWLRKLRLSLDGVNNGWNQWVLGYDMQLQAKFLSALGLGDVSWDKLVTWLGAMIGLLLLTMAAFILRQKRIAEDHAQMLYRIFCRKLAKRGIIRGQSEGPLDFAARIATGQPAWTNQAHAILKQYIDLRYGEHPTQEKLRQLRRMVQEFES